MSTTPREIGTLIAVILKARNLPNKRHIGKQDPYCVIHLNGEKRRTKAIKRGGQHPEWDEEVRFTLYEADSASVASTTQDGAAPPPPPKKSSKDAPDIQGGKFMSLACYAEDIKEPDFIGEAQVDLTEVLTKGETDEWFTLMNKDRYSGEVYLELTFWSNEPAPTKKPSVKAKAKKQYGGPGTFIAHTDPRGSSESPNGSPHRGSMAIAPSWSSQSSSTWRLSLSDADLRPEALPSSLRSSSSIAQIGLYRPSYEDDRTHSAQSSLSHYGASTVNSLTDEMGQMNLHNNVRRRLSLPQLTHSDFIRRSTSSTGQIPVETPGYGHVPSSSYSDDGSIHDHEHLQTSVSSGSRVQAQHTGPGLYHPPYEPISRSSSVYSTQTASQSRGPRLSLPTSSSGFMPIPMPAPSTYTVPTQQVAVYQPAVSATPAPSLYRTTPAPSGYGPLPVPTSALSTSFRPPAPTPVPTSYVSAPAHAPAPSSSVSQQYNATGQHLLQSTSYQSIPQSQSQSAYSYQSYSMPPSMSNNSVHQFPQQGINVSNPSSSVAMQPMAVPQPPYSSPYGLPPNQAMPVPAPPASIPPPPVAVSQQQQYMLHHPSTGVQGPIQQYSTAVDHSGMMTSNSSQLSVNIPPPPPLNPSPSQGQGSRPLPEPPSTGPSPMQRRPTTSASPSQSVALPAPRVHPSVSYPSYGQIPPPPPLHNAPNMSPGHHSPQMQGPPPIPNNRRVSLPPPPQQQQPVPSPPPPPSRAPSAQALYHNAINRQSGPGGINNGHPLPPPPPGPQGQWQAQSAYEVMQQPARQANLVPPPPPPNYQGNFTSQPMHTGYPGALPVPPRLPSSQSQQYQVTNGWQ